ncbi:glucose 1-dehydrogenase [Streptomyces qaidamensis]|uniref:glucose 1-dehydrogenase n=1 Tax=Streptomyces qaidamensis TaxID=1783515 RepID=UPI00364F9749
MMNRLNGKTAIVTGGARGMGESHVRRFIEEGAQVVLIDRLAEAGDALVKQLGSASRFVQADVTDPSEWARAVEFTESEFGAVDVLVNNAGILVNHHLADASLEDYERTVRVNQVGTFLGMQAVIPSMRRAGRGSIVNIGSTAGLVGFPSCFAYVATKWAVRGMTKAAALELAAHNIRVNAVHPGDVETEMTAKQRSNGEITTEGIALGRFGDAAEITNTVLFLASDESSYITGADLAVDGGFTVS